MKRIFASLLILSCLGTPVVSAQSWAAGDARSARQNGDIIPLAKIIKQLKREHGGQYLEAELFSKPNGGSVYHIAWEKNGRKLLFVVDAKSGNVIRSSGG
jgi:uncharacterized membrane protein YkoI